jgi:hypothetical protein
MSGAPSRPIAAFVESRLNAFLVSFPDIFRSFVTVFVVAMITGHTKYFIFHIR